MIVVRRAWGESAEVVEPVTQVRSVRSAESEVHFGVYGAGLIKMEVSFWAVSRTWGGGLLKKGKPILHLRFQAKETLRGIAKFVDLLIPVFSRPNLFI